MKSQKDTVLVTGGASGIGRAVIESLLFHGWNVVVADLNVEGIEECRTEFKGVGSQLLCEHLDITDEDAVCTLISKIEANYSPLTGVLNSAGFGRDVSALETDVQLFRKLLEVNLIGSFVVAREAAKRMIPRGRGSIINIASVSGIIGNLGRLGYGASKGGVLNMTKVLAVEWAKFGIRVNAIAPGPIETPLVKEMHTEEARQSWLALVPQARYGSPKEISGAVVFLLDDSKSSYITGQTLAVDGGLTIGGVIDSG